MKKNGTDQTKRRKAFRRAAAMALVCLLMGLSLGGCAAQVQEEDGFRVLTSFYPIYVLTLNVTEGIEGVQVRNMAVPQTGCLHDYQLSTEDMKALERADVFLINGAGMEEFMQKAIGQRPDLTVVDSSEGISLLEEDCHEEHEEGHEGHEHEHNSHIWMDPARAAVQVENIAAGLAAADPAHQTQYRANAKAYQERLWTLDGELRETLAPCAGGKLVAFHEAFAYFADAYDLEIITTILADDNNAPSARELIHAIDEVRKSGAAVLVTDTSGQDALARSVAADTGAVICPLDSVVYPVGEGQQEAAAYEQALRQNARLLREAFDGQKQ